jgi:hypothetical protein
MPYACWIVRTWAASAFPASAADSSAKYSSNPPGVTSATGDGLVGHSGLPESVPAAERKVHHGMAP